MRRTALVAAGAAALLFAAVAGFAPGLLPPAVRTTLAGLPAVSLVGQAAAVLAGLAACRWLWASGGDSLSALSVETAGTTGEPVVGADFDGELAAAGAVGEATAEAEARVRADLRALAIETYRQTARCDRAAAARAVESGAWTDDPAAAAFVGGPDAPAVPFRVWLRDALSEDGPFHRQAVRTIRAIDDLGESGPTADGTEVAG